MLLLPVQKEKKHTLTYAFTLAELKPSPGLVTLPINPRITRTGIGFPAALDYRKYLPSL
jgi:hypothetical protein